MKKDCFFASVDLNVASVGWNPRLASLPLVCLHGITYEFRALSQGFRDFPRNFIKLLKAVLAHLRHNGHTVLAFLADTLLQGNSLSECCASVLIPAYFLHARVHHSPYEVRLLPTQVIIHFKLYLDSVQMRVPPTEREEDTIRAMCTALI